MKMTNRWNRLIYWLWAPVYDRTANHFFLPGRRQAMERLDLRPGERVLLVGIGTGADLPLLPLGVSAVGVDLSPAMLARARLKLTATDRPLNLILGDAEALPVRDNTFDAAILNLILSVVPDGGACLRATLQALKPGGRAAIFDKFLPDKERLTPARKAVNLFSRLCGTDITRRFGDLAKGSDAEVVLDVPSLLKGVYRVILIKRSSQ